MFVFNFGRSAGAEVSLDELSPVACSATKYIFICLSGAVPDFDSQQASCRNALSWREPCCECRICHSHDTDQLPGGFCPELVL